MYRDENLNAIFFSFVSPCLLLQPALSSSLAPTKVDKIPTKKGIIQMDDDFVHKGFQEPITHITSAVSRTVQGKDACAKTGLDKLGITHPSTIFRNLSYNEIFQHEKMRGEGTFVNTGTLFVWQKTYQFSLACIIGRFAL